jgi:hypothetical protein
MALYLPARHRRVDDIYTEAVCANDLRKQHSSMYSFLSVPFPASFHKLHANGIPMRAISIPGLDERTIERMRDARIWDPYALLCMYRDVCGRNAGHFARLLVEMLGFSHSRALTTTYAITHHTLHSQANIQCMATRPVD